VRILFVAFGSSIHTTRWISQLRGQPWEIYLFPVDEYYLHPDFRDITVHSLFRYHSEAIDASVRLKSLWWPFNRGKQRIRNLSRKFSGDPLSASSRLARLIRSLKPDIIHSLEMQHAGYLTLDSCERLGKRAFPPWIYSCWGNDIYYFGKQPQHKDRIRAVLASCDYLLADCHRDMQLAKEFGFKGEMLGVFPGPGGFDIQYMKQFRQSGPVSSRKVIVLKGRHGDFGGRALIALQALHLCAGELSDYEIVVMLANDIVPQVAKYIAFVSGVRITVLPEHTSHEEVLKIMGRARVAINITNSEGTPNFLLEAMVMGAFPIQSDTISTAEWIKDGQNGFLVSAENVEMIAASIRRAISADHLVNEAASMNSAITQERIDRSVVQPQVVEMYKRVATRS
jgi:glycosyltransferase involved in cell wall biosynthesis